MSSQMNVEAANDGYLKY